MKALAKASRFLPDGRLKTAVQARLDAVSRYRPDGTFKGAQVPVKGSVDDG